jgi:50S ribosomal protein L16 3-hydroxylase
MKTGLATLIHPHSITEFLSAYEKNEPFLVHHQTPPEILKKIPFLSSLENLLNTWPSTIEAHLPDVRDELSAIETNPIQAQKLFQNGMGLLFKEANKFSPLLQEWVDQVRMDLGLSALTFSRNLIYATPDGKGTAPHFDQNINFVLQLQGTKIWSMAPNQDVIHPLTRHTMGQEADPELQSYLENPLSESMPLNAKKYELRPGSLLFVPRGMWHSTEAAGDALALNFTFTAPTWLDLMTAALRGRLAQSPEWRETADGVSDVDRRRCAEEKFDELLATLKQDLPYWRGEDILNATDYLN